MIISEDIKNFDFISHRSFLNVNFEVAKDLLLNIDKVPSYYLCLSDKNPNYIILCLKISETKFWKIKIEITYNLNSSITLKLDDVIYESFEKFIDDYVNKFVNNIQSIRSYRKYQTFESIENMMKKIQNLAGIKNLIEYNFSLFSEYPNYVIICYFSRGNKSVREYIKIIPNGLLFYDIVFENLEDLTKWFKSNFNKTKA